MSSKSKTGIRPGLAPPEVSVAHYALNAVAAMPQLLRAATTHGCPKKPLGFIPRRSVTKEPSKTRIKLTEEPPLRVKKEKWGAKNLAGRGRITTKGTG